jgi:hypothetical protein
MDFEMWGPTPTYESRNPQSLGLRFRALLGQEPEIEIGLV